MSGVTFHSNSGIYTPKYGLEIPDSATGHVTKDVSCINEDCQCVNLTPLPSDMFKIRWRFDTWVTVVVTIGAVGIVLTGCMLVYISCKACTEVLVNLSIYFYTDQGMK